MQGHRILFTFWCLTLGTSIHSQTGDPNMCSQSDEEKMAIKAMLMELQNLIADEMGIQKISSISAIPDMFDKDIMLTRSQIASIINTYKQGTTKRKKRKLITGLTSKWFAGIPIKYRFSTFSPYTEDERARIRASIEWWSENSCLVFEEDDNPDGDHIVFIDLGGCFSFVGRINDCSGQPISLSRGICLDNPGIIAHEIGHALGLWHEHQRPDRDTFIDFLVENFTPEAIANFAKVNPLLLAIYGIPFDVGSLMHYGAKFASINMEPTLLTKNPLLQQTIGSGTFGTRPSFYDMRIVNREYCSKSCSSTLACKRQGYANPQNCSVCLCPDGFSGPQCENVSPGVGATCGGLLTQRQGVIQSPGYGSIGFFPGQECNWLIKAPEGSSILLSFIGPFNLGCIPNSFALGIFEGACYEWVEIRFKQDLQNTGARFCCSQTPEVQITSESNEMLVLFRANQNPMQPSGRVGFMAKYRIFSAVPEWSSWGSWTNCTQPCGGCGTRTRVRNCTVKHQCRGSASEVENCNRFACSLNQTLQCQCTGYIGRAKQYCIRICFNQLVNGCCQGFTRLGIICIPSLNRIRTFRRTKINEDKQSNRRIFSRHLIRAYK